MNTLVIAEHRNGSLSDQTSNVLAAAVQLGGPVDVLVAGAHVANVGRAASKLAGVRKVKIIDNPALSTQTAEEIAAIVLPLAANYTHLITASSSFGRDFLPRVAALLNVMQVSDVVRIVSEDTFVRPIYAGNAIQTVRSRDAKCLLTIRTSAFEALGEQVPCEIEVVETSADLVGPTKVLREVVDDTGMPDLGAARVVVSGGRGLGSQEKFEQYLYPLAKRLGAAVGASRAAVDAGFAPNEWQVGQTGRIVAPSLYIAVGISGAIQHLAGMKDSTVIVAINKDANAPIFQVADYGLVGDLFEILPALEQSLDL